MSDEQVRYQVAYPTSLRQWQGYGPLSKAIEGYEVYIEADNEDGAILVGEAQAFTELFLGLELQEFTFTPSPSPQSH